MTTGDYISVFEYARQRNVPFETCRRWAIGGLLGPVVGHKPRLLSIAWLRKHGMLNVSEIHRDRLTAAIRAYAERFPPEQRRDAMIAIMETLAELKTGETPK